jgi:hypothetical protein
VKFFGIFLKTKSYQRRKRRATQSLEEFLTFLRNNFEVDRFNFELLLCLEPRAFPRDVALDP